MAHFLWQFLLVTYLIFINILSPDLKTIEMVGGRGEAGEAGHELQPRQVVNIGAGDVEDPEAGGQRQAVAGVHHEVLARPQQLPVNMKLLKM